MSACRHPRWQPYTNNTTQVATTSSTAIDRNGSLPAYRPSAHLLLEKKKKKSSTVTAPGVCVHVTKLGAVCRRPVFVRTRSTAWSNRELNVISTRLGACTHKEHACLYGVIFVTSMPRNSSTSILRTEYITPESDQQYCATEESGTALRHPPIGRAVRGMKVLQPGEESLAFGPWSVLCSVDLFFPHPTL